MNSSTKPTVALRDRDACLERFPAGVNGRRAEVTIRRARIEWSPISDSCVTKVIPVAAITSASTARAGWFKSHLIVTTAAATFTFRVDRAAAARALAALAQLAAEAEHGRTASTGEPARVAGDGTTEKLINLAWFRDVGILTEAEFAEHRSRLLGS